MFPHVDTEDGSFALADNRILILGCHNGKSLLLSGFNLDEPTPSTALDAQKSGLEGITKFRLIAPNSLDLFAELWGSG